MDVFYKKTPRVMDLLNPIAQYFALGKKEFVLKSREFNILLDAIHPNQRGRYQTQNQIPYQSGYITLRKN